MSRLPTPGADNGTWGNVLNDFLGQSHASDGTLKAGSVGSSQVQDGALPKTKLDTTAQASLTKADGSLQASNNLSDVTAGTARTNLGLGTAATMTPATLAADSAFSGTYAARRVGMIDAAGAQILPSVIPDVHASPPTLAYSDANPISGGIWWPYRSSRLGFFGALLSPNDTSHYASNAINGGKSSPYAIEFTFYGTEFAIRWRNNAAGTTGKLWTWVDDKPLTATPGTITGVATTQGSTWYQKITFGSAGLHRIRVHVDYLSIMGVVAIATQSIMPPSVKRRKLVILGDSFLGGASSFDPIESYGLRLGLMLGMDTYLCGQGGTGYMNPSGTSGQVAFGNATRLDPIITLAPDYLVVSGSVNDDSGGYTSTQVGNAAAALYSAVSAGSPTTKIVAVGEQATLDTNTLTSTRFANQKAIRDSAAAASNVLGFVDPIGVPAAGLVPSAFAASHAYVSGDYMTYQGAVYRCTFAHTSGATPDPWAFERLSWLFGTGGAGGPTGDGNRDLLLASDGTHPNGEGSCEFWAAQHLAAIWPLLAAR